jgi:KDO2-lipid IV(A) lauroyltransferase
MTDDRRRKPSSRRGGTDFYVYKAPAGPPLSSLFSGSKARKRFLTYWVTDNIQNAADISVHYALKLLPIDWCSEVGAFLGRFTMPRWHKVARARAMDTIARLFPELSPQEREDLYRRNCENQGRLITEFSVIERIANSPDRVKIFGGEDLAAAVDRGPVVIIGMHIGNWEIAPAIVKKYGRDVYIHFVPPRQRGRAWIAERFRRRQGLRFLTPGLLGMKDTYRVLREGGIVSIFCDEGFRGTIRAPLFGREPHRDCNMALVVRLARSTGATICPWYSVRTSKANFECHSLPSLVLPPEDRPGARLKEDIQLLNDLIEPIVKRHIDQWYFLDSALPKD